MIKFSCSSCGKRYRVKREFEGKKTTCAACSSTIVVPTISERAPEIVSADNVDSQIVEAEVVGGSEGSHIEFSLRFFPLAFFFFFCTPVVVVNGKPANLSWGKHTFDFPPGTCNIKIFVPYMFWPECGANIVTFDLRPGEHRQVSFFMWPWVFAKGSINVA